MDLYRKVTFAQKRYGRVQEGKTKNNNNYNFFKKIIIFIFLSIYTFILLHFYLGLDNALSELYKTWNTPRGQEYLWEYRKLSWFSLKITNHIGKKLFVVLLSLPLFFWIAGNIIPNHDIAKSFIRISILLFLFVTILVIGILGLTPLPLF